MNRFEGSFGGDGERIDAGTVLECGVCWWVFDPLEGDDTWQIPRGTAFSELPAHWRCPSCDAAKDRFMVIDGSPTDAGRRRAVEPAQPEDILLRRRRELLAAYAVVEQRMRGLPVYNDALTVEVVGLQRWGDHLLGVVITPWCMNILLLPLKETHPPLEGTSREVAFPSGRYDFTAGQLEGVGPLESCSLFSPMERFDDNGVAAAVARHALDELLRLPEPPALSRRGFLRGGERGSGVRADERAGA